MTKTEVFKRLGTDGKTFKKYYDFYDNTKAVADKYGMNEEDLHPINEEQDYGVVLGYLLPKDKYEEAAGDSGIDYLEVILNTYLEEFQVVVVSGYPQSAYQMTGEEIENELSFYLI